MSLYLLAINVIIFMELKHVIIFISNKYHYIYGIQTCQYSNGGNVNHLNPMHNFIFENYKN